MTSRFLALGLAAALLTAALPLAHAQFADETQDLFTEDPDAPATKDDLITIELDDKDDEVTGNSGAQSVEELCCRMTVEERQADGLCFEAQCPDEADGAD